MDGAQDDSIREKTVDNKNTNEIPIDKEMKRKI
jgi:hypothetical protein